ncbi:PFL family protein [Gallibacterium sp. AGMB14963]|uniref:PFL family protein n=1 Tax=Gallibacterium faecale TaxID=3019086 RepID=UPI0022F1BE2E|nr:PFL family protein [Gallibacterium sp. AGMB14963]MDA3979310.1 PFL family protein [Gallibacterium sp. AGMB14963]
MSNSIQSYEILETLRMVSDQNFDVRTITIGIDLHDCISDDIDILNQKIYDKIVRIGGDLVQTARELSAKYGIPIVNQRISVTPIAQIAAATKATSYVSVAQTLDRAAKAIGVSFIGGFSALVHKGMSPADEILIRSIPEAMQSTDIVCSSINIGSTKAGINMDAVKLAGEVIKQTAEITPEGFGCAKIVVFCNAVEDNPFMAGAFHGSGEGDAVINVGVSGPGVVKAALESSQATTLTEVAEIVKKTAFKITRVGELIGQEASKRLGIPFGILDLSLAPTPAIGDSVARILEQMGLSVCGTHGTTAALALLNDAVKKGGMMASSSVGGLSGAFIPVSEDEGMIAAASQGVLTLDKLEAMTAVCSVGLDMIAVPGYTSASTISGIIADEAAIGMINSKTTAVRIIPVPNKDVGEMVEFGGLLGYAPIMPVKEGSCEVFVNRGGRIPAPVQSLKN